MVPVQVERSIYVCKRLIRTDGDHNQGRYWPSYTTMLDSEPLTDSKIARIQVASMKSFLHRRLDLILEDDTTQVADDPYQSALALSIDLEEARRRVTDLERQLLHVMDRLCGGLAMGVRKQQPGLNIGLDNGSCKIGYKDKHLHMKPDLSKHTWVVDGGDTSFADQFLGQHAAHMVLEPDMAPLAQAITAFFTGHYGALGENINGRGIISINNQHVDFARLAHHVRRHDWLLAEGGAARNPTTITRRKLRSVTTDRSFD